MRERGTYVLIDPFGRPDSGVTSYTTAAAALLLEMGHAVSVITVRAGEQLEDFCCRAAAEAAMLSNVCCVEAPESLASTRYFPDSVKLHIRLHCSRSLGALVQGMPYDSAAVALEQRELSRAAYVSAPSSAAVVGSELLFQLPSGVAVYPNPVQAYPVGGGEAVVDFDVVFVGRLHLLKGAQFLDQLARLLPHRRFLVVAPQGNRAVSLRLPPNVRLSAVGEGEKPRCYQRARVTVVPSLFETASMVGIESLAAGVPVVTWGHIGLAEYAGRPWVTTVPPGDIEAMAVAVDERCASACEVGDARSFCLWVNTAFRGGVQGMLRGEGTKILLTPLSVRAENHIRNLAVSQCPRSQVMAQKSSFQRKLNKLKRDPGAFFRDSRVFGGVCDIFTRRVRQEQAVRAPDQAVAAREPSPRLFTHIGLEGKVLVQDPPSKPVGTITALLYADGDLEKAEKLIDGLAEFHDFKYVRRPALQVGTFADALADESPLALVNRIELANKKRLAAVDHVVLLDPPALLTEALRSSGVKQRMLVVVSEPSSEIPDPWHTDVVITVGEARLATGNYRRAVHVDSVEMLPVAIRKVVQEGCPKEMDMLLPLVGFQEQCRSDFLSFDSRYHQGVLRLGPGFTPQAENMGELCRQVASSLTDMAVLDTVYMKYKNLCEAVEAGGSAETLISYCLYDGVLFDVQG